MSVESTDHGTGHAALHLGLPLRRPLSKCRLLRDALRKPSTATLERSGVRGRPWSWHSGYSPRISAPRPTAREWLALVFVTTRLPHIPAAWHQLDPHCSAHSPQSYHSSPSAARPCPSDSVRRPAGHVQRPQLPTLPVTPPTPAARPVHPRLGEVIPGPDPTAPVPGPRLIRDLQGQVTTSPGQRHCTCTPHR